MANASNIAGISRGRSAITDRDEGQNCAAGLEPGMIVRDSAGIRKRIIRSEGDKVIWEYVEPAFEASQREHSTDYSEFADTHFTIPRKRPSPTPAGEQRAQEIREDVIYVDRNGKRVRVTGRDSRNVHWVGVDENTTGNTKIESFLKNYRPEGRAA